MLVLIAIVMCYTVVHVHICNLSDSRTLDQASTLEGTTVKLISVLLIDHTHSYIVRVVCGPMKVLYCSIHIADSALYSSAVAI